MSGFPKLISFLGVINDVGNFHDCQYLKYLPNIEFAWEHQAGFLGDYSPRDESSRLGRSRKSINHQERIFRIFGLQARWQWVQDCWQGWIFTQIHSHKYAYTNAFTQIHVHKYKYTRKLIVNMYDECVKFATIGWLESKLTNCISCQSWYWIMNKMQKVWKLIK